MHVIVLIDALGWTYVCNTGFLTEILPHRYPLRTVLGFSSGAIPTILTGSPPAQTGHWNLFYYDPEHSPFRWLRFFQFLPEPLLDNRYTRKLLKELGRKVLGLGQLFECCVSPTLLRYFDYAEKRNIYQPGGIAGARSIFDELSDERIAYRVYSYHDCADAQIIRQAHGDIANGTAEVLFLYLSEMDMFLHMHCLDTAKVRDKLSWYDAELRKLFEHAMHRDPRATFTVLSDHGMSPVRDSFDLMKEVAKLELSMPRDYLAVYDSTMARFWCFSREAQKRIEECLNCLPCGRILPDYELRSLGVFFSDKRYGELVFLLNPGCILAKSDFNGPQWRPAGMHGYHPDDRYSDAVFLTNRQPSMAVRQIADAYHWMRTVIELAGSPAEVAGSHS